MTTEHTTNWPDLAVGLYEQLMARTPSSRKSSLTCTSKFPV